MTIFVKLSADERLRAALPVLLSARRAVVFEEASPIDAIQQAGMASLACVWAREALLGFVSTPTLQQWQADPSVKQSDRTRAFDRAIRLCRRACGHKGGWHVAHRPAPPVTQAEAAR